MGHWTYECKKPTEYRSRPTRSALLRRKEKEAKKSTKLTAEKKLELIEKEREAVVKKVLENSVKEQQAAIESSEE